MNSARKNLMHYIGLFLLVCMIGSIIASCLFKVPTRVDVIGNDVEYTKTDQIVYSYSALKYRDLIKTSHSFGEVVYESVSNIIIETPIETMARAGDVLKQGDIIAVTDDQTILSEKTIRIVNVETNENVTRIEFISLDNLKVVSELSVQEYYFWVGANSTIVIKENGHNVNYSNYEYVFDKTNDCYKIVFSGIEDFYLQNEKVDIQYDFIEKAHLLLINKKCVFLNEENHYIARNISIDNEGNVTIKKEQLNVINEYEDFYEISNVEKVGSLYLYY